ncbi:hypothetical protein AAFF_G00265360 [Aldrovandia affinis]|uniref:C2H2-type domain-containing protein n=1 Tax=Aldrovandia affinis TaxID=143900 RepID=A0AAD7RBK0_9TELE|nr:hypothetical protein AAFF_G00265360 [Aldrovandia affinis]
MSTCVSFQTQIASIMEVLAKTAVAEISKLVDVGSAAILLEMCRSRRENEALKRRLRVMGRELRAARGCAERGCADGSRNSPSRVQARDGFGEAESPAVSEKGTAVGTVFAERLGSCPERDGENIDVETEGALSHVADIKYEPGEEEQDWPDHPLPVSQPGEENQDWPDHPLPVSQSGEEEQDWPDHPLPVSQSGEEEQDWPDHPLPVSQSGEEEQGWPESLLVEEEKLEEELDRRHGGISREATWGSAADGGDGPPSDPGGRGGALEARFKQEPHSDHFPPRAPRLQCAWSEAEDRAKRGREASETPLLRRGTGNVRGGARGTATARALRTTTSPRNSRRPAAATNRSPLASIMEVLANAAVEEISKLVDDGYAILHLEMTEYQKENESLKMRLHVMELEAARGRAERTSARRDPLDACFEGVARETAKESPSVASNAVFGLTGGGGVQSVGPGVEVDNPAQASGVKQDQPADAEPDGTKSRFIKEENPEEGSDPQRELKTRGQGGAESCARGEEVAAPASPERAEELAERPGTRRHLWEVSGSEAVLRSEADDETVGKRSEQGAQRPIGHVSDPALAYETPGHLQTFTGTEVEDPCSFAGGGGEGRPAGSDLQPVSGELAGVRGGPSPFGSPDVKPDVVIVEPIKAESATLPSERGPAGRAQSGRCLGDGERGEIRPECADPARLDGRVARGERLAAPRGSAAGAREKRFFCKYCGKGFTRQNALDIHQRVHTGEKPFRCAQCGKRFSDSSNHRRHQSVHSGERPFSCTLCERSFSHQHQLKCAGVEEGRTESLLIKEERLEEDPQGEMTVREERAARFHTSDAAPEKTLFHSQLQAVSPTEEGAGNGLSSFQSLGVRPEAMTVDSTPLASIMEVLANAAVEEISKLVDDGYAILHLEMTEYQKENESLKMRLHVMELEAARGRAERTSARGDPLDACFEGVARETATQCSLQLFGEESPSVVSNAVFGLTGGGGVQSVGPGVEVDNPAQASGVKQPADVEPDGTKSRFIKEENPEEGSDPQRELKTRGQGGAESCVHGRKWLPRRLQSARRSSLSGPGPDATFGRSVGRRPSLDQRQTMKRLGRDRSRCVGVEEGRTESLLIKDERLEEDSDPQGEMNVREERAALFHTSDAAPEKTLFHSQLQAVSPTEEGAGNGLSSFQSLGVRPEAMTVDSTPVKVEALTPSAWEKDPVLRTFSTRNRRYREDRERVEMLPGNANSALLPQTRTGVREKTAAPDTNRFPPSDKIFAAPRSGAVTHQRTGAEKRRVEEGLGRSLSSVSGGAEVVMMDPVPVKMEVAMQPVWSMQSRSRDRVGTQHTHRDWEPSIVEVLANAAVAEICTFVDDGYAVLRLEVSQSRKENEALKRRLRTMERRLAQGRAKGAGLRDNFANNRPAIPALDKSGRITDGQLGEQVNIVLWRDGREGHAPDVTTPVESTDTGEREPKASSIKQEEPEEDPRNSESPQEPKISRERAVGSRAGGGGRPPVQETQNKAENHTEEFTEQHRTRHGVWEVSGPESVLKAEAESESVKTLQHRGAERRAGGLNSLDSGFVMFERPAGQLGTYCTQGNGEVDGYDPSEIDLDSVSVHSELWSVPRVEEGLGRSLSSSVSGGAEVVMMDPVPVKMEVAMQPAWSMQSRSRDRIASIMEVLANAAVAEICQVVDDGYAVLRLEMSQYQKENKALKRRLQMAERQSVRRCAERAGARASVPNARFGDGAQACPKLRGTARGEEHFPTVERVLDNRRDFSLNRATQPIVLDEDETSHQIGTNPMCAGMEEGRTESLLIKDERRKESLVAREPQGEPEEHGGE